MRASLRAQLRRRIILPAAPVPAPRPPDERERYDPVCVLSSNSALLEMVRAVLYRLPSRRLVHIPSRRVALAWLDVHPRCPLLFEDDGTEVWASNPSLATPVAPIRLPAPLTYTPIWQAARKLFPWQPGTNL
jgi:hypothetical protein